MGVRETDRSDRCREGFPSGARAIVGRLPFLGLTLLLCTAGPAGAERPPGEPAESPPVYETEAEPEDTWDLPPDVPRPDFMARKPYLPDFLLKDKRDGFYFTAMPAVGYDTDTGFNIGAFVELYWNGERDDPFFRSTPYRHKLFVGAVASTEGKTTAFVASDHPYLFDSPYRLQTQLGVDDDRTARYFGIGNEAMQPLFLPPTPNTPIGFERFSTYGAFEQQKKKAYPKTPSPTGEQGLTYSRFDEFKLNRWYGRVQLERDMFGGVLRPLVGLQLSYAGISDYTGTWVTANDYSDTNRSVQAVELPTRLAIDCARRVAVGCGGGWDNLLKLGVTYDTRDFEPDPRSGVLAQALTELSTKILGSRYNYGRVTANVAGYYSPIPDRADLVLVARALFQYQWDSVPFYSMDNYASSTDIRDFQGLGGIRTIRGFRQNRFIGPVATVFNTEMRWTFTDFNVFSQHIALGLTPFFDAGRVYSEPSDITTADWALGYGAGLTLKWNLSTVVRFDYGRSSEGDTFYMELAHPF